MLKDAPWKYKEMEAIKLRATIFAYGTMEGRRSGVGYIEMIIPSNSSHVQQLCVAIK